MAESVQASTQRPTATPWAASLVLHAAALGLAAHCAGHAPTGQAPGTISIELVDLDPTPAEPGDIAGAAPGASGRPAAGAPARRSAHRISHRRAAPRSRDRPAAGPVTLTAPVEPNLHAPGDIEGASGDGEAGDGLGGRGGGGGHGGGGLGSGTIAHWERVGTRDPPPAPPPPSKARPARLIYPSLLRTERPGEVFIARLIVNRKGLVAGVKLVRGVNMHQDQKASTAVWRFRYDPALDDAGRPIESSVVQRFMLR